MDKTSDTPSDTSSFYKASEAEDEFVPVEKLASRELSKREKYNAYMRKYQKNRKETELDRINSILGILDDLEE
jgi:hypothetical protein